MSNGDMDNIKGKGKEGLGKVTGDKETEREGQMDQAKGKAKNAVEGAKDNLSQAAGKASDAADRK
ncbi:MAG: CsbD family protein [Euzebyaceae bacterium]|nr:CsbD family protein [Euzebyaceae bacterium]